MQVDKKISYFITSKILTSNIKMAVITNGSKWSRPLLPENSDKKVDKEHVGDE